MMLVWIRNIIYWILLAVITPFYFVLVLLSVFFPLGVNKVTTAWALIVLWLMENVIGLKYQVIGKENIPMEPAIICCKHQSGWETFATQKFFPLQVFVAKRELFKIPFFGWGLKMARTIGIDRKDRQRATQQILDQGKKRKAEGLWITIFPEGTRITAGYRGRYRAGAGRMAKLLQMDLVPVALNSGEFWPRHSWLIYPGMVTVVIGQPISYQAAQEPEELVGLCEEWIEAKQVEIQGQGPFALQPPCNPTPMVVSNSNKES